MPDRQRELLGSISAYLRHRDRVLSEWGYEKTVARTQGLKVLFAGESGTGKTMSAQVLAAELGLEMFRVDLATIVSKYIGETEKNLDRIFNAAEGSNAILFFDEADALFGKRSEISDSHDRYANIEVAYLLQKMEGYPGAVILATNYRRNIDDAFVRRLDFVIDFPFPEAEDRERIWALVLPDTAPLADDIDLALPRDQLQALGRRDQELLAVGRVPGRRRRRRDRDAPPRARRRAGVRQAGPAHARGRLRALPRADPGAEWQEHAARPDERRGGGGAASRARRRGGAAARLRHDPVAARGRPARPRAGDPAAPAPARQRRRAARDPLAAGDRRQPRRPRADDRRARRGAGPVRADREGGALPRGDRGRARRRAAGGEVRARPRDGERQHDRPDLHELPGGAAPVRGGGAGRRRRGGAARAGQGGPARGRARRLRAGAGRRGRDRRRGRRPRRRRHRRRPTAAGRAAAPARRERARLRAAQPRRRRAAPDRGDADAAAQGAGVLLGRGRGQGGARAAPATARG